MLKNLDNKTRAYGTLIVFGIIAFVFWYYADIFAAWSATENPLIVIIVSILINPAYIFLIYTLYKQYNLKGLVSGIFIAIAIDIMSLSHSIPKAGIMPTDHALYAYSDTSIFIFLDKIVHGQTATFILYILVPVIVVYLALRIIRKTASFNKIVRQSI